MSITMVLGGGGAAAVGWELGVLLGLAQEGVELTDVDQIIGTSAGAIVGAQVSGPRSLADLFQGAQDPPPQAPVTVDYPNLMAQLARLGQQAPDPREARRRIGTLAVAAKTLTQATRRDEIGARIQETNWPTATRLVVTAVDAGTGEFVTFTRESGVDLIDAVAASCAVPGVWPPMTIEGHSYIDGAVRSPTNASLSKGAARVLVLAPLVPAGGVERELRHLDGAARSLVIAPDAAGIRAFGTNPLDPCTSPASAAEGLRQGRAAAEAVGRLCSVAS